MQELRNLIEKNAISVPAMAQEIGVAQSTIRRLLEREPKTLQTLRQIRKYVQEKTGQEIDLLAESKQYV